MSRALISQWTKIVASFLMAAALAFAAAPQGQAAPAPAGKAGAHAGKAKKHKGGKKHAAKWGHGQKAKAHAAKPAKKKKLAHQAPAAVKKAPAAPTPAKTAFTPPAPAKELLPKTKEKPKGLAAKSLTDVAAERDLAKTKVDEPADAASDEGGSSIWQVLMVFLLFTAASAGTFVYLKRRNANALQLRQNPDFTGGGTGSGVDSTNMNQIPPSLHGSMHGSSHFTSMPQSGLGSLSDSNDAPCSFEQFVEMQVAQACWAEQGLDLVSHLRTYFNSTVLEWSKISVYWKPRYLASDDLKQRFTQLEVEMKRKYGQAA